VRPIPAVHPQAYFGFYDVVLGFDRNERRAWIFSSGLPDAPADRPGRAAARLDRVLRRLAERTAPVDRELRLDWRCALELAPYAAHVSAIIEHIRAGDIYQANFTCRHSVARPANLSAATFFRALTRRSPAPFSAFLACGDLQLASVSPERFIRLDADHSIETRPIKGTRPRGADAAEDRARRLALEQSAKDHAENLMIVDLMRNDLGRVAEIGSVTVPSLCAIESFANVHHLVSEVRARLRPGLGPVDLLRATLPGGSITGAPKIRAMQIIDAIEAAPRGAYCGVIGWIGFDGAMDTSIAIRTVTLLPDRLEAQAGGGIVADSDPADEFAEMLVKVRPLLVGNGP
jgi:para-aminobenzoate synthetase component 1